MVQKRTTAEDVKDWQRPGRQRKTNVHKDRFLKTCLKK